MMAKRWLSFGYMARVLFVCLHNAGRSQMSELQFNRLAGGRHEARSAGTRPAAEVHPEVVQALAEVDLYAAGRVPRKLDEDLAAWADVVVTMGCGDECPYIPGKDYRDWELTDPKGLGLDQVRAIRDGIGGRVRDLVAELDRARLEAP
jgi:arsenate reductase